MDSVRNEFGNVTKGEKGSGKEEMVVAFDLVAACSFGAVTRKRADRVRRRKLRSSSSTSGFSSLGVASCQHVALPSPPSPASTRSPPVFRLTPVYVSYHSSLVNTFYVTRFFITKIGNCLFFSDPFHIAMML